MKIRRNFLFNFFLGLILLFIFSNTSFSQVVLISPSNLYMGQIPTNSKAVRQLYITNISSTDLNISSISLSNTNGFQLLNNPGAKSLKLLESLTLDIEFSPASTGSIQTEMTVVSNASSSPNKYTISGFGSWGVKPTFERIFGYQGGSGLSSVTQTSDGGYILGGSAMLTSAFYSSFYIVKTDSYGDIQWSKTYAYSGFNGDNSIAKILQTSDGGYIVLGNTSSSGSTGIDVYLAKLDSGGNVIWEKIYGGNYDDSAASIVKTTDGYMIAGSTLSYGNGSSEIYVVNVDNSGNEIWHHNYGGTSGDTGSQIISTNDGNFVVVGTTSSFGASIFDIYLIKIDGSGNKIWDKLYGGSDWDEGKSVAELSDGSLIVAGFAIGFGAGARDIFLIKTNASGVEQWHRAFGGIYQDNTDKVVLASDGFILLGTQTISIKNDVSEGNIDLIVIKTDFNGNQLWQSLFGGNQNEGSGEIINNSDGNSIIVGGTSSYSEMSNAYFLNINTQGKITNVIEEQDQNLPSRFLLFNNYPNPFNNQTQIIFQLHEQSLVELSIYNIIGQKVTTLLNSIRTAGKYNVGFNSENLTSGVYFYQIKTKFGVKTQKMVLIK